MQANTTYDMPQNYYFGGAGEAFVPPLAIVVLVLACGCVLFLRRRHALIPFLTAGITLLPYGVNVVILDLNFPPLRILVTAAWLRMLVRRDLKVPRLNTIDRTFVAWAVSNAIAFCLLWRNTGAVVNRVGFLWSTLGSYFVARAMIQNKQDMILAGKTIALIFAILAPAMALEHVTGHNLFAPLGAPELSDVREGAIRARGPFGHAIIAGTIAAVFAPLFAGMARLRKHDRALYMVGILCCFIIAISSASSTPIMTFAAGIMGLCAWPLRKRMGIIRWLALSGIVALQLVMKAPVWFLLNHVSGALGGSGYHRSMLIDNFVKHFWEWWLIGTRDNASWGYDMWDVDNAYVAAGVGGGLITFLLFIAFLVAVFKRNGYALKAARGSRQKEWFVWASGVSVFASTIGFLGIVFFDQSILLWYSVIAIVSITPALLSEAANSRTSEPVQIADANRKAGVCC